MSKALERTCRRLVLVKSKSKPAKSEIPQVRTGGRILDKLRTSIMHDHPGSYAA